MYGILVDVTRCTGCERCVTACLEANGLDQQRAAADRLRSKDGLSANRLVTLDQVAGGRFARKSCLHCTEPSCVAACLVGGLTKSKEGPVIYNADKCIGCRYCMLACPFHIPRYEWDKTAPFVRKCDMCHERLKKGKRPACVETCPNDALFFGDREQVLKEVRDRLRNHGDRYLPRIWGEKEFGGTSVVYISDVDLTAEGWPAEATASIPSITTPLIEKTPLIGGSVGLGLVAVNWIIQRRMKLAAGESETHTGPESGEEDR
jgi:formate dehydrogenase iron-sulfur subunit